MSAGPIRAHARATRPRNLPDAAAFAHPSLLPFAVAPDDDLVVAAAFVLVSALMVTRPRTSSTVRAMAQIGGDDAAPAVKFMIAALLGASEVDGYNMMIYLSLLGPVAEDAVPAIQQSRIKNPVLRQTAIWAVGSGRVVRCS